MAVTSASFCKQLGADIATALGDEYSFFKSRLEIRREVPEGHDVVIFVPSSKHSPYINIAFYFGKNFSAAKRIERAVGAHQFYYHIQQFSLNRQPLYAPTYQGRDNWGVDIADPPTNLTIEIVTAIQSMAFPFFARFSSIRTARDAIAADDPGCFGGPMFWRQLLLLDLALDDLSHFNSWYTRLDDWTRDQADQEIAKHLAVSGNVV